MIALLIVIPFGAAEVQNYLSYAVRLGSDWLWFLCNLPHYFVNVEYFLSLVHCQCFFKRVLLLPFFLASSCPFKLIPPRFIELVLWLLTTNRLIIDRLSSVFQQLHLLPLMVPVVLIQLGFSFTIQNFLCDVSFLSSLFFDSFYQLVELESIQGFQLEHFWLGLI